MCHRLPLLSLLLKTVFKSVLQKKRPTEGYFRFAFDLGDWHASGGFMNACVYGVQLLLNAWICICLMLSYTVTLFFGKEYVNESVSSLNGVNFHIETILIFFIQLYTCMYFGATCAKTCLHYMYLFIYFYIVNRTVHYSSVKCRFFFFWHIVIYTYTSGKINKIKNANFISFASYWILKLSIVHDTILL